MLRSLVAFALIGGLLTVTPGPDSLLVLRTALVEGRRTAMVTSAGIVLGLLSWGLAAAFGVTALLQASTVVFAVLRWAGGAYLVWLGVGLLREARRRDPAATGSSRSGGGGFRRGLLTNLANPKIGVFYLTFLPQFVPPGEPVLATTMLLTLVHVAEGLTWFCLLTWLARRAAGLVRSRRVGRGLDASSGAVFVGLGAHLALAGR